MKERWRLSYKAGYAVRHPRRVPRYVRRYARDLWLRATTRDHVSYYRAVMRSAAARDAELAVGSRSHERWLATGQLQLDYLLGHGLRPSDRVLEIGCGSLRAGWRLIDYLQPGHYHGLDISPEILLAAGHTLVRHRLQDKLPHLFLVDDLRLEFLPAGYFTVVHAHSVFSHSPLEVVDECLAHVGRVLAPGGFFDFTFNRTESREHDVLREDFHYRTQTLVDLAGKHALAATFMDDWERLPHPQSKIRITHAPTAGQGAKR